jgi:hypothetical protein
MADKEEGSKLDQILSHLAADSAKMDAFGKRMDAMETMYGDGMKKLDAACMKMDAMEEKDKKADAARKDAEKEEEEKKKADAARADAEMEEKKKADAAEEEKKKADAARADAGNSKYLTREDLAALLPKALPEDERQKFVAVQSKWEPVAHAFGDARGAPRFQDGETVDQYRRRMAGMYKKHSGAWKDVDLGAFADAALTTVEDQILVAAMDAARNPTDLPDNTLRMVTRVDQANRTHINFVGSEKAAWLPFCNPDRKGRINTRFERA